MAEQRPDAPDEDAKARFREALERKKAANHRSAESARSDGRVHGAEAGATRRTFRRKTG